MSFTTDKQTLDDLNMLGKYKPNTIFSLFNQVHTAGGEMLLEKMFRYPLSDPKEINKRSSLFKYFQSKALTFPFNREQFERMEDYLNGSAENTSMLFAAMDNLRKLVLGATVKDDRYAIMQSGFQSTISILEICSEFISGLDDQNPDNPYSEQIRLVKACFRNKRLLQIISEKHVERLPFFKLTRYDHWLRHTLKAELEVLTETIYYLDVYIAVAQVARVKNFCYADALPKESNCFSTHELCHPLITKAVGNTVSLSNESNMIFLTGANMAGKSTLMKSVGIGMYLAHMGFPVAAKNMQFSIKDGIYSSINVPDDLNRGYSHFYAEVLRVKTVAGAVSSGKDMVVIFDELFKGTNVKDAYDATLAVTEAFSAYRNCFFIISTHIIEVGDSLQERCENILFSYLPTIMEGSIPRYPYKLEKGITTDRQGMIIIENEGILDILREENPVDK